MTSEEIVKAAESIGFAQGVMEGLMALSSNVQAHTAILGALEELEQVYKLILKELAE